MNESTFTQIQLAEDSNQLLESAITSNLQTTPEQRIEAHENARQLMQPNLKALLERLLTHNVDFVLIGGFAASVHGCTMVTQDIDICAAITEEEVAKLCEALKDLHPKHRMNPNAKHSFLDSPP